MALSSVFGALGGLYRGTASFASLFEPVGTLALRLLIARVFWRSGLTKWDGFTVSQNAYDLFAYEYFADYDLPEPVLNTMTVGAAIGEVVLPVLLVFGLLGRFAAFGLLVMALVIQLFVYPEEWWAVHSWWVGVLVFLALRGPGPLSIDRLIGLERK